MNVLKSSSQVIWKVLLLLVFFCLEGASACDGGDRRCFLTRVWRGGAGLLLWRATAALRGDCCTPGEDVLTFPCRFKISDVSLPIHYSGAKESWLRRCLNSPYLMYVTYFNVNVRRESPVFCLAPLLARKLPALLNVAAPPGTARQPPVARVRVKTPPAFQLRRASGCVRELGSGSGHGCNVDGSGSKKMG